MTRTVAQTDDSTSHEPLRLWPGVVAVVLQWLAWFVLPIVVPEAGMYGMLAGVFGGLAIVVWWPARPGLAAGAVGGG